MQTVVGMKPLLDARITNAYANRPCLTELRGAVNRRRKIFLFDAIKRHG